MFDRIAQHKLILDLENRHEELLTRLDELDKRVAKTLAEFTTSRQPAVVSEQTSARGAQ